MTKCLLGSASAFALLTLVPSAFAQNDNDKTALEDVIHVTGQRIKVENQIGIKPDQAPVEGTDITRLIDRTPGAARIGNGELSGQMQYRGLFGERLNLRINGQRFTSGGPNLMDPVFHYAPSVLVSSVVIDRGISPVSKGPGLAGGADAIFKSIAFSDGSTPVLSYDLTSEARSINDSIATGGVVGMATDTWRFNLLGSYEEGNDTEFKGGKIAGTQFQRSVYGLSFGIKEGEHLFTLDARRQNTGPSGNPPFPMDIRYFDSDFVKLGYTGPLRNALISANIHYTDVSHAMNNFSLRPAPMPMRHRETFAGASTIGADLSVEFAALQGDLTLGIDLDEEENNVRITNPRNNAFFVHNLPNIKTERYGAFAEWTGDLGIFNTEVGLRIDDYKAKSGEASVGSALPMGPRMLSMAFNNAEREQDDTVVDGALRLWTDPINDIAWRFTLAHKNNLPNYLQRYGWLPTKASGGLADGNIYVGNLALEPEKAIIAEVGFDYSTDKAYFRPTVFIREIDNYIQGTPFDDTVGVLDTVQERIANMNGDATPLRFNNVDARLYGFDFDAGYKISDHWRFDMTASYVKGERQDIDDNLYRVSPPSVLASLTYEQDHWSLSSEVKAVANQNKVSRTNSEEKTSGYAVLNIKGDWQISEKTSITAGIENVLDQQYRDHLSGYNRNAGGDVLLGERLPGAGRGVFLRLNIRK